MKVFIIISIVVGLVTLVDISDSLTHIANIAKWLIEKEK